LKDTVKLVSDKATDKAANKTNNKFAVKATKKVAKPETATQNAAVKAIKEDKKKAEREAAAREAQKQWRNIVLEFHPEALTRLYSVPHIYFNRIPYDVREINGVYVVVETIQKQNTAGGNQAEKEKDKKQSTLHRTALSNDCKSGEFKKEEHASKTPIKMWSEKPKAKQVKPDHTQADFSQQHVLTNLRVMAQGLNNPTLLSSQGTNENVAAQPMFIVSGLNFKNYLNVALYNKVTAHMTKLKEQGQGDFDFIIIAKGCGILVIEMKSIGLTDDMVDDEMLKERLSKALKQLSKGVPAAIKAISDVASDVPVRARLCFPYISSQQLHRVLINDVKLLEVNLIISSSSIQFFCYRQIMKPGITCND
jgi:hypothetical protein